MIYILGGQGFIGSGIAKTCESAGRECTIVDLHNYESFRGKKCRILINAAGNSKKFLAAQDPIKDFDASVRSVRASLVDFTCQTYVLISSADVYPDSSCPAATIEDQDLNPSQMTPYGFHKYVAELYVRHCAKEWLVLRGGGFVGPSLKKNAIYDILHGGPLWLDPESELQYIHTHQFAALILQLLDLGIKNEIFNLSATGVVKLSEAMKWAERNIPVQSNSPRVRCELNLSKVSAYVDLPDTRSTVRKFVESPSNV